jgi:predicted adenylyl cyclase CyaB
MTGDEPMPTNIEIKARARDPERQFRLARVLAERDAERLQQEDIFFAAPHGRLKLRLLDGRAELIAYVRADGAAPRRSEYEVYPVIDPAALRDVLTAALGIRGRVRKTRHLLRIGQTRVHFDDVEELGFFIELEVVLQPGQDPKQGAGLAAELMARLEIAAEDLEAVSYIDLLERAGAAGARAGQQDGHGERPEGPAGGNRTRTAEA